MKIIRELRDIDVIGKEVKKQKKDYSLRAAARAVVLDSKKNVAILSVPRFGIHKIPGGGIEKGEDIKNALYREILEETGSKIKIIDEIGEIIEYKNEYNEKQISYCYLVQVIGPKGIPSFTDEEKKEGFGLEWVSFKKAIQLFEKDSPEDSTAKFIQIRDYIFLLEAKKIIQKINL